jgi:hypothetical protein
MNFTLSHDNATALALMGATTEQQINDAISRLLFEKGFKGEVKAADSHGYVYIGRGKKIEMRRIE